MTTATRLRAAFSSLAAASCLIAFCCDVAAQTLPRAAELLARAIAKSYPRSVDVAALKSGIDWEGRWSLAQYQVTLQIADVLPPEPLTGTPKPVIQSVTFSEEGKTLCAAAVWLRTGSPAAASEVKRRAMNLASWLHGQWTPAEQTTLLAAIRPRPVNILSNSVPYGLNNGLKMDSSPCCSRVPACAS